MMVLDHRSSGTSGVASFRRSRSGPERDLVDWFLAQKAVRPRRGERVTFFREPAIPAGCPDLVAVVWSEAVASRWSTARMELTPSDLRAMHLLSSKGPSSLPALAPLLGSRVLQSLERLQAAGMVRHARGTWRAESLSRAFAARRIIAVEAKISAWRDAIDQAFLNTWFAGESYVLLPKISKDTELAAEAGRRGVGLLSKETLAGAITPNASEPPRSYLSWMFNEWAWRASAG